MLKVFGKIHDDTDPFEYFQTTLHLLKELIGALPPRQTETLDAKTCHEGFMKFNEYQKKYASQGDLKSPIQNVHLAYQNGQHGQHTQHLQKLNLENVNMLNR